MSWSMKHAGKHSLLVKITLSLELLKIIMLVVQKIILEIKSKMLSIKSAIVRIMNKIN